MLTLFKPVYFTSGIFITKAANKEGHKDLSKYPITGYVRNQATNP